MATVAATAEEKGRAVEEAGVCRSEEEEEVVWYP
jgi:hypothetical protein